MANNKAADAKSISFDSIIQADRQKKKQEDLANQLLGKNRRSSAPGSGSGSRKGQNKPQAAKPGSLASRIGVAKRSVSATVKPTNPAPATNGRSRANGKKDRINADQVWKAFQSDNGNVIAQPRNLSIKGASGPFIVIGKNFSPGTTAADIQSALERYTGPMLSCRITANSPAVVAELVYAEKSAAELAVANFHNQRADGKVLDIQLKSPNTGKSGNKDHFTALRAQADRERVRARRGQGQGQKNDLLAQTQDSHSGLYSDEMMVDAPAQNAPKKNNQRRGRR